MKKIFLMIMLLLVTGCQVEYNLEFTDEKLKETIKVIIDKNEENKISDLKNNEAYAIFNSTTEELYNKKFKTDRKNFYATYDYTYNINNFSQAFYLNQCFDAVSFVKSDNNYILTTSKGFNCMEIEYIFVDSYNITITTNHNVIGHNADEVKKGKYIWKINTENARTKQIEITFGQIKEKTFLDILKENIIGISILSSIIIIFLLFILYIYIKNKKNNEI